MKTTMQETRKKRTYGGAGKKLFIILFSLSLAAGASAQRGGGHAYVGGGFGGGFHGGYYGGRAYYAPAYYGYGVGLGFGYGLGWGWGLGWGYPGWYGPWYGPTYPPYYYGRGPMPPQLNEQIDGIKSDYKQQIKDVKHDKSLPKAEREQRINQLEQQRDAAITQARHDYYNNSMKNYNNGQPQRYNQNGQPQNSQQQNNNQQNNQQPNSNNLQPGPTNGNSSSDAEHPEYSDKSATGNQ